MRRKIIFWHGYDAKLADILKPICGEYDAENGWFWYEGSLDTFAEAYKRPFIVHPDYIAITQHHNWGQR